MPLSIQIAAGLAGLLHIVIFVMESVLFTRPTIWRRFLVESQRDADTIRPWALNQGFYNLFLASGALGGVVAAWAGADTAGTAIALYACACMIAAAVVLLATDRRMLRAAAVQAGPALVAVLLAAA
jgi:putative membrane protein